MDVAQRQAVIKNNNKTKWIWYILLGVSGYNAVSGGYGFIHNLQSIQDTSVNWFWLLSACQFGFTLAILWGLWRLERWTYLLIWVSFVLTLLLAAVSVLLFFGVAAATGSSGSSLALGALAIPFFLIPVAVAFLLLWAYKQLLNELKRYEGAPTAEPTDTDKKPKV